MKGNLKRWLVVGLAVAVIAAGGLTATVAVVSAHGGGGGEGLFGGPNGIDMQALLADELGITVDRLQAAQDAAHTRALDQALEQGLITQEQYDQMKVREALQSYLDPQALTAQALGVTVDELGDKTMSEWLDEKGLDRDTFETQLQAAYDAAIAQAVTDGVITQEQADALPSGHGFGRMPGMPGGRGDFGEMRGPGGRGDFNGMRGPNNNDSTDDSGTMNNNSFHMQRGNSTNDF